GAASTSRLPTGRSHRSELLNTDPIGPGRVVVVGNLTIDDVVLPDGRTLMARLGGNTVHSATAVLACGVPVAIVTRRGDDFPAEALETLAQAGADVSAVASVEGP